MNFIKKINKYLLEHYPLIWNTRLVWMLGINIVFHLFYFVLGFTSVQNITDLKSKYRLEEFYFDTSVVYYNFLLSILIIVIWIAYYLRNNAFKNSYSLKKGMLFKQFCILVFIFFISSTQFFSFKLGLRTKVKQTYNWEEVDADIKTFNRTAIFLVQNRDDYQINQKKYPKPFPLKVASQNKSNSIMVVDTTRSYIEYKERYFQFYKLDKKYFSENKKDLFANMDYLISNENPDFKNRIVEDVSSFKDLIHPSLLNYSRELYSYGQDSLAYTKQLTHHERILTQRNHIEIKKELITFIELAKKYEVKHNLEEEKWFNLINNKPNYLLKTLINTSKINAENVLRRNNYDANNSIELNEILYSKSMYCDINMLDNFFKNVYEAYHKTSNSGFFYFLFVFSIVLALLLFVFKTTDLKSLLLSFVSSIIVAVLIVLLMGYVSISSSNSYNEFLAMVLLLLIIVLLSVVSFIQKWKKIIVSILLSLAVFALPLFLSFSVSLYDRYSTNLNTAVPDYKNEFMSWYNAYGFWAIMAIWLIGIAIYSAMIRKLKARPE